MLGGIEEGHALVFRHDPPHAVARRLPRNSTRTRERVALCTCLGGVALLAAYLVLHALHVIHRIPTAFTRISSIPLFANVIWSALVGAGTGILGTSLVRSPARILRHLPACLVVLIVVFVVEVVLLP